MSRLEPPRQEDTGDEQALTFWEHLDILRGSIIKMMVVIIAAAVVAFCFKDLLFDIILAPKDPDFITYRLLGDTAFSIQLVNIGLTEQFMIHLKAAFWFGCLAASPYVLFLLYRFIAPALYDDERFLGTYSVSDSVRNLLSLQSYTDTLFMMSLVFGIVFELPVISWLLAVFGVLRASWMKRYRRHAYVAILIVAAVITPTSDAFTMLIVSVPICFLYEASILIVRLTRAEAGKEIREEDG